MIAERYGMVKARLAKMGALIPENDCWDRGLTGPCP